MAITIVDGLSQLTTVNLIHMEGCPVASGPMADEISQRGIAGFALKVYAYKGEPFVIQTIGAYASAGAVALGIILYAQYQQRRVVLTDQLGYSWGNVYVRRVTPTRQQRILAGVGSLAGASHMLFAEWVIQSAAVQY